MTTKTYRALLMGVVSFLLFSTGLVTLVFAMDGMEERGNRVLGFDQMKTTHHFRLFQDGEASLDSPSKKIKNLAVQ